MRQQFPVYIPDLHLVANIGRRIQVKPDISFHQFDNIDEYSTNK